MAQSATTSLTASARPYSVNSFERKLILFNDYINEITLHDSEESPEERRQKILETLRFDQFTDKIRSIFGNDIKAPHIKNVFKKISSNPDANIDWSEIFGYDNSFNGSSQGNNAGPSDQNDSNKHEINASDEIQVFMISFKFRVGDASGDKARRDTIQFISYSQDIDCFITAAQKGAITVWNNKLRIQACSSLKDQVDGWTTGCCYMPNLKRVAVTSERSLTFWDFRSKKSTSKNSNTMNLFTIQPIIEPLTCIDCATNQNRDFDKIIYGDSNGYVMLLKLNANDLASNNTKPDPLNDDRLVLNLSNFKNSYVKRKIHDEAVIRIKFISELESFISCSGSSKQSLAIEELEKFESKDLRTTRYLSINKGVNAFCYCSKAHLIATGGVDKMIRLYNPLVLNKPTGKLVGHLFTITELVCNEKDQQLISLSSERVFRVWDLATLKCLQVFSDTEERPGEKRIYSIIFDERRERLLTGSSVFDCWPLTRSVQDTMQLPHTHDKPIIAVLYNSYINQIATLCSSDLRVWEAETSRLMYSISEIHGKNIEATCMALDPSGYRLATGGYNGSMKVWDFGAGQELKHKQGRKTRDDLSITKLVYTKINDELYLIAFGWNNKVKMFHDTTESNDITLIKTFDDHVPLSDDLISLSKYATIRPESMKSGTSKKTLSSAVPVSERLTFTPESRQAANQTTLSTYDLQQLQQQPQPELSAHPPASSTSQRSELPTLLKFHEIQCVDSNNEANLLVSAGIRGELVFWNKNNKSVNKLTTFPAEYTPTSQVKRGLLEGHSVTPSAAAHLRKANCICIFIHKTRKFEVILPKEATIVQQKETSRPASRVKFNRKKSQTQLTIKSKGEFDSGSQFFNINELLPPKMEKEKSRHTSQSRLSNQQSRLERNFTQIVPEAAKPKAITRFVDVSYPPLIATGHDDSTIRLWNENGELLHELVPPAAAITGAVCSAICTDSDANYLYAADARGYVTMWSIGEFIQNLETSQHSSDTREQNKNLITMLVCWKAHTNRINDMYYVSINKTLITVSTDESARIWWGSRGRYIGFLGQIKPLTIPLDDHADWAPPYDISEPPMYSTVKVVAEKQTLSNNYEYPLVIDKQKFGEPLIFPPLTRGTPSSEISLDSDTTTLQNKKFYGALMKPKHTFDNMETITATPRKDGSVYASLPLYKERKSEEVDLKMILLSNPYRKSRELSYITLNRIMNKNVKKENETFTKKNNFTVGQYKPPATSNSMPLLSATSSSRIPNSLYSLKR